MASITKLNKVADFYCTLPETDLMSCLTQISYTNREERRKYSKIKDVKERVRQIVTKSEALRIQLVKNIFEKHRDEIDSEITDYSSLIKKFNKDNCILNTIYMFYLCCDKTFDDEHFDTFLESQQFKNTVSGQWDEPVESPIEQYDVEEIIPILEYIQEQRVEIIRDEKNEEEITSDGGEHMRYYVGLIERSKSFYNFEPKFILEDNEFINFDSDWIDKTINLSYVARTKSQSFLDDVDRINSKNFLFGIKFNEDDLEINNDFYTGTPHLSILRKLDLQKFVDEGYDLKDIIVPAKELNIYKVATPAVSINSNRDFNTKAIPVNEGEFYQREDVLLKFEDNLFGPFVLNDRLRDDVKYIEPDVAKRKYLLDYYPQNSDWCDTFSTKLHPYSQDEMEFAFLRTKTPPMQVDIIPDEILLEKAQEKIDIELVKSNPTEFARLLETSPFFSSIPTKFRQTRIQKLTDIITRAISFDDEKRNAILSLINSQDPKISELLDAKYRETNSFKMQTEEKEQLQNQIIELGKTIERKEIELKNSRVEQQTTKYNLEELENKKAELTDIESKIAKLNEKHRQLTEIVNLQDEIQRLKNARDVRYEDVKELELKTGDLKAKADEAKAQVRDAIKSGINDANSAHLAFDPYIANEFIEAAAKWKQKDDALALKNAVEYLQQKESKRYTSNELVDILVQRVQCFRNYSYNDVVNMYICMTQNFLTIFSGEPGTGKTSICNILSATLGLETFGEHNGIDLNRYVPISVERGWASKRDLIGYYNPLTKKYDCSNAKFYDALRLMDTEGKQSRFPFVILLDEANLSPIEYYWADFMRVADRDGKNMYINIGADKELYVTKTLRFLATINNDQTTEQLSPRLLDRAWIIKLPKSSIKDDVSDEFDIFDDVVLWEDLENTFAVPECKSVDLDVVFERVCTLFENNRISVSPRVKQSMKRYICVAQSIMEDELPVKSSEKALDYAIVQKLMPKINGYYDNYKRLFEQLRLICDENHLEMTKSAIVELENFQEQNMGYCQYLV